MADNNKRHTNLEHPSFLSCIADLFGYVPLCSASVFLMSPSGLIFLSDHSSDLDCSASLASFSTRGSNLKPKISLLTPLEVVVLFGF